MPQGPEDGMFGAVTELNISPLEYSDFIAHFNRLIREDYKKKLAEKSQELGADAAIWITGSDARGEKGSAASKLEFIAWTENRDVDLEHYKKTLTDVLKGIGGTNISEVVEVKGPDTPMSLFRYDGKERMHHGRTADAVSMYGHPGATADAKIKLGEEILKMPGRQLERVRGLVKDASRTTERRKNTIAGKERVHFELDYDAGTGRMYFNPKSYQLSFKIGPLRWVQYALLYHAVRETRQSGNPRFISTLPPNIIQRLRHLSDEKMLNISRESVEELSEHYAFFLRLYHKSENAYIQSGHQQTVIELNKDEVSEIGVRLPALIKILESIKIEKQPS